MTPILLSIVKQWRIENAEWRIKRTNLQSKFDLNQTGKAGLIL
ncbi:hypothetical protein ELI_4314 [Eubacterium callanderi]|uniref:Uncharacterized protein n=1 Tax=Eubacterium callanderi TaxID=53442 RepID=E3GQG2_9FIRM|nr:hypothetical protein ELI_4314 [Eubacterium callanderi]